MKRNIFRGAFFGALATMLYAPTLWAFGSGGTDLKASIGQKKGEGLRGLFEAFGTAMVFGAMAIGIVLVIVGLTKLSKNSPQDSMMDKLWPMVAGAALLAIGGVVGIFAGTFGFQGDKGAATDLFN